MATIYSSFIYGGHNLSSPTDIVLEPGFVWVIRDMDIYMPGVAVPFNFQIIDLSTDGTFWQVAGSASGSNGIWQQWRGRQVFVPESTSPSLRLEYSSGIIGGGADLRISGWKLTPP